MKCAWLKASPKWAAKRALSPEEPRTQSSGIVGPAGIPRPVVSRLNQALIQSLRSTEVRERVALQGFELWTSTPEEFAEVIRADRERWGKLVKASGARID
jgi:tripartite-type tricarboxylate transporter receptor subunit TctC